MLGTEELLDELVSAKAHIEQVIDLLHNLELPKPHTCLICINWAEDKCNLYNCVPPPKVIVGVEKCPSFDMDLPF